MLGIQKPSGITRFRRAYVWLSLVYYFPRAETWGMRRDCHSVDDQEGERIHRNLLCRADASQPEAGIVQPECSGNSRGIHYAAIIFNGLQL